MHHCLHDRLGGRDVRDDVCCWAESVIRPAAEGRNTKAPDSSVSALANRGRLMETRSRLRPFMLLPDSSEKHV